jgi:hypothetical protein
MTLEVTRVNSGYSNHMLNTGHIYGIIADTMIIITWRKRKYFNTLEKYHIYESSRDNLHMNDTHNTIIEALHEIYTG